MAENTDSVQISNRKRRIIGTLAISSIIWILLPWDTWLKVNAGTETFDLISTKAVEIASGSAWMITAPAVGISIYLVSRIIESGSAYLVALGMRYSPKSLRFFSKIVAWATPKKSIKSVEKGREKAANAKSKKSGRLVNLIAGAGVGSGTALFKYVGLLHEQDQLTNDPRFWEFLNQKGEKTSKDVSTLYGILGFFTGGGITMASWFGYQQQAQTTLDILGNSWTYVGIFAAGFVGLHLNGLAVRLRGVAYSGPPDAPELPPELIGLIHPQDANIKIRDADIRQPSTNQISTEEPTQTKFTVLDKKNRFSRKPPSKGVSLEIQPPAENLTKDSRKKSNKPRSR